MPVVCGRLTCCVCGADLGDAGDPYRDPDCFRCRRRDEAEERSVVEDVTDEEVREVIELSREYAETHPGKA